MNSSLYSVSITLLCCLVATHFIPPIHGATDAPGHLVGDRDSSSILTLTVNALHRIPQDADPHTEWRQTMICIDEESDHKLKDYTGNYSYRHKWLHRDDLTCFAMEKPGCFRHVIDDFITSTEAHGLGKHSTHYTNQPLYEDIVTRIRSHLEKIAGSRLRTVPNSTYGFQQPTKQDMQGGNWTGMHSDYQSSLFGHKWVYTAILYFSTEGLDHVGGETGFVDEFYPDTDIPQYGLVVPPKTGRLLVFSGGVENMHGRLPLLQGKRGILQLMFDCEDGQAQEDLVWDRETRQTAQVNYDRTKLPPRVESSATTSKEGKDEL